MTESEFDESATLSGCLAGHDWAWNALIGRYSPMVLAIARSHRLGPHDSQDVNQSTWVNVLVHLGQLRSPDRMSAWIATTARRECLKHIERGKRHLPIGDEELMDVLATTDDDLNAPEDAAIRSLLREEVQAAFKRLPARDRTLLGVLMSDTAPNYDTISEHLGIPRGSIGPLRRRALTRLRNLLPEPPLDNVA